MANAWRPLEEERHAGWRYRWTKGITGRANSVLAIGGEDDLDGLVEQAERFYAERDAPACFLVSDASAPATVPDYLAARGYRPEKPTIMMTASPLEVATKSHDGTWSLRVAATTADEWFECYWSVEAERGRMPQDAPIYRDVLLNSGRPQRFVGAVTDGLVVATGQAVFEAGWCGVQCMATRAAYRGRGAASAVLATIASEAVHAGTDHLYLAVQADNGRAISLYRRSGFRPAHRYQYWRQQDRNTSGAAWQEVADADSVFLVPTKRGPERGRRRVDVALQPGATPEQEWYSPKARTPDAGSYPAAPSPPRGAH